MGPRRAGEFFTGHVLLTVLVGADDNARSGLDTYNRGVTHEEREKQEGHS